MPPKRKKFSQEPNDEHSLKKPRRYGCPVENGTLTLSVKNGRLIQKFDLITTETESILGSPSNEKITQIIIDGVSLNIPPDHKGNLRLELEFPFPRLQNSAASRENHDAGQGSVRMAYLRSNVTANTKATSNIVAQQMSRSEDESKCGFLKLPTELRDMIYSEVFVSHSTHGIIPFLDRDSDLSAALLRTCRQIYQEGRKWLYSENRIRISRDWRSRGGYWEPKWVDLGYETMSAFFDTIGPVNASLLRSISLHLSDASPSAMPHAYPEDRRYVYNTELFDILEHLAKLERLQNLRVIFEGSATCSRFESTANEVLGRRREQGRDAELHFFSELMKIKADNLELKGPGDEEPPSKVSSSMLERCRKAMQRDQADESSGANNSLSDSDSDYVE